MKCRASFILLTLCALFGLIPTACISDAPGSGVSPELSADEVDFGDVVCGEISPMARLKVYNRSGSNMRINSLRLANPDGAFRMNVDGVGGNSFSDIDLRAGDSLYVFVDCLIDAGTRTEDFTVEGAVEVVVGDVSRRIALSATAINAVWLKDYRISAPTAFDGSRAYAVADSLVVESGSRLTLQGGTRLLFAAGARLVVRGELTAEGTPEAPVELAPTRGGTLFEGADYSIVPGQWGGVLVRQQAESVALTGVRMRGSTFGICFEQGACAARGATLLNCLLHTATQTVVSAEDTNVSLLGCCLSEGGGGILRLGAGTHTLAQCTLANSYPFATPTAPVLVFTAPEHTQAEICNSIIWGSGGLLRPEALNNTGIYLRFVLLGAAGSDDSHFISCLWDADPKFALDPANYLYDYSLQPGSPAIGRGSAALLPAACRTDLTGRMRRADAPALGAYAAP